MLKDDTPMKFNFNNYKGLCNNTNIYLNIHRKNIKQDQHPQNNRETVNRFFKRH